MSRENRGRVLRQNRECTGCGCASLSFPCSEELWDSVGARLETSRVWESASPVPGLVAFASVSLADAEAAGAVLEKRAFVIEARFDGQSLHLEITDWNSEAAFASYGRRTYHLVLGEAGEFLGVLGAQKDTSIEDRFRSLGMLAVEQPGEVSLTLSIQQAEDVLAALSAHKEV